MENYKPDNKPIEPEGNFDTLKKNAKKIAKIAKSGIKAGILGGLVGGISSVITTSENGVEEVTGKADQSKFADTYDGYNKATYDTAAGYNYSNYNLATEDTAVGYKNEKEKNDQIKHLLEKKEDATKTYNKPTEDTILGYKKKKR